MRATPKWPEFQESNQSADALSKPSSATKIAVQQVEKIIIMSYVHLLSASEAQTRLTQAVKKSQGSNRTASWKPASRPSWWINEHTVTLHDGTQVCTGIFDGQAKKKWRKSHLQAALFLYEQYVHHDSDSPTSKAETKLEQEVQQEVTPSSPTAKDAGKDEQILAVPKSVEKHNGRRKQRVAAETRNENKSEPQEEPAKDEEIELAPRTRGRRNRTKNEAVIHKEESPVPTHETRSHTSSSSSEDDESPTPIVRRRRARGRRKVQKTSPQIQAPISTRQLRSRKARNGRALVRNSGIQEARRESIPRSPRSPGSDAKPRVPPSRLSYSAPNSDDDIAPIRPRRRAKVALNVRAPAVQDCRRKSPAPATSLTTAPIHKSPETRKRSSSGAEIEQRTDVTRTPLQARNDPANMQKTRLRKKRRIMDSDNRPSDKENQTPSTAAKSKSAALPSVRGKNVKSRDPGGDPIETETVNTENEEKEQEDFDEQAEHRRKAQRVKLLCEQIEKVKAERDHHMKVVDDRLAQFEYECNVEKTNTLHKVRLEYRKKKMKFSKQVLEMPISKFANDHGGNVDEWMMHQTEEGVNRTFHALHHGQNPNIGAMGPPRTTSAMSRRAALNKTARKTRRQVDNEAAAGMTVRRSQRTAAKVATEKTRKIIASTPRTAKKEASIQGQVHVAPSRATSTAGPVTATPGPEVSSEQEMDSLVKSMNATKNPVEAFRSYTRLLQEKFMSTRK